MSNKIKPYLKLSLLCSYVGRYSNNVKKNERTIKVIKSKNESFYVKMADSSKKSLNYSCCLFLKHY